MFYDLPWREMDPAGRGPFEPAAARERALGVLRRVDRPLDDAARARLEAELGLALVTEYGAWTWGWRWGRIDGGPMATWCCFTHSLGGADDAIADRVATALAEWHSWLLELSTMFAKLRAEEVGVDELDAVARAVAVLLPEVLDRTRVEDAWYGCFERVATWYLQSRDPDALRIPELVREATSGRFRSWIEPDATTAREVCEDIAIEAATQTLDPVVEDALETWWVIRGETSWGGGAPPRPRATVTAGTPTVGPPQ